MIHLGMKLQTIIIAALLFTLCACAGPNGSAGGSHRGASAHSDIFRIPLP